MRKYNPKQIVVNSDVIRSQNLELLKNFLANMGITDLINLGADQVRHISELIITALDDTGFQELFPDTAIVYYNRTHKCPLGRDTRLGRSTYAARQRIVWSDKEVLRQQRQYVKAKLIPSCKTKFVDMAKSHTRRDGLPDEIAEALKDGLRQLTNA